MAGVAGVWAWSALLAIAAGLAAAIAVVALRNRGTPGARWLGGMAAVSAVWILTDLLGVAVAARPLLVGLEYLHLSFGTVAVALWLLFVLAYTGRLGPANRRRRRLAWVALAAVVAVNLSGPLHGQVYADLTVVTVDGVAVVKNAPGPLYRAQVAFVFGTFPAGLALLFRSLWVHDRLFSRQALALLVGSTFPYVLGAVDVLDLEPVGWLPMVPVSIALMGAALAYAVLRAELLAAVPATRRIGEAEAFDELDDGVAVLGADGTLLNVNDSACWLFDHRRDAVLGEPLATLVGHDVDGPGDLPARVERRGRVVEPQVSAIEGAAGDGIGHTVLFRDVTDPRRREQRLEVLNRVLRHDLRNAVTAVELNLELLIDADDDDERAALAASVRTSLDDLDALGEKASVVERTVGTESEGPADVELPALVGNLAAAARERFPGADVDVTVPGGAAVRTNRVRLAVALRNLLENALVHGGDQPRVTVEVAERDRGVAVAVHDDGPGVPDHEIAVLKEGTETSLEHASGLGLWLVHWAVTSLGGTVSFEERDEGTTVRLWVPDADGR